MLVLRFIRPNTTGVTFKREFSSYSDAEDFIEKRCEKLANNGWDLSELSGSNSLKGSIECTHDYEADILLIDWHTRKE